MPGSREASVPIVRMYGVTMNGHSVVAHVHGFTPYFYIPAPVRFQDEDCSKFQQHLNRALSNDARASRGNGIENLVLSVQVERKESIRGYHGNTKKKFLKITIALPKLVAPARRILETGFSVPGYGEQGFQTFESNIDFEVRFMVDKNVVGCNWIEIPAGKYQLKTPKTSRCQIEINVCCEDFISHDPNEDEEWSKVAPIRILSFDIECAGRKGIFPEPDKDPVIQIANMVIIQGEKEPFIRNIFCLDTCAAIVGSDVRSFKREDTMLKVQIRCINVLIY